MKHYVVRWNTDNYKCITKLLLIDIEDVTDLSRIGNFDLQPTKKIVESGLSDNAELPCKLREMEMKLKETEVKLQLATLQVNQMRFYDIYNLFQILLIVNKGAFYITHILGRWLCGVWTRHHANSLITHALQMIQMLVMVAMDILNVMHILVYIMKCFR